MKQSKFLIAGGITICSIGLILCLVKLCKKENKDVENSSNSSYKNNSNGANGLSPNARTLEKTQNQTENTSNNNSPIQSSPKHNNSTTTQSQLSANNTPYNLTNTDTSIQSTKSDETSRNEDALSKENKSDQLLPVNPITNDSPKITVKEPNKYTEEELLKYINEILKVLLTGTEFGKSVSNKTAITNNIEVQNIYRCKKIYNSDKKRFIIPNNNETKLFFLKTIAFNITKKDFKNFKKQDFSEILINEMDPFLYLLDFHYNPLEQNILADNDFLENILKVILLKNIINLSIKKQFTFDQLDLDVKTDLRKNNKKVEEKVTKHKYYAQRNNIISELEMNKFFGKQKLEDNKKITEPLADNKTPIFKKVVNSIFKLLRWKGNN